MAERGREKTYPVSDEEALRMIERLVSFVAADVSLVRAAPQQGLTLAPHQVRAVLHLGKNEGHTVGDLAKALDVSLGWASRIADELVNLGLVDRDRDTQDRRVVRLKLTPQAVEAVEKLYEERTRAVANTLAVMSPAERRAIDDFIMRLNSELDRLAGVEQTPMTMPVSSGRGGRRTARAS